MVPCAESSLACEHPRHEMRGGLGGGLDRGLGGRRPGMDAEAAADGVLYGGDIPMGSGQRL